MRIQFLLCEEWFQRQISRLLTDPSELFSSQLLMGCRTGSFVYSRKPVLSAESEAKARAIAEKNGTLEMKWFWFDIWFVSRGKLLEGTKIWFQATEIVRPSSIFTTWEDSGLDWSWLGTHLLDTTAWFAFCDILRLQTTRQMHGLLGDVLLRVKTRKYCVIDNACPDQPPVDYSSPVSMNLDAACQTRFSMIFIWFSWIQCGMFA